MKSEQRENIPGEGHRLCTGTKEGGGAPETEEESEEEEATVDSPQSWDLLLVQQELVKDFQWGVGVLCLSFQKQFGL